MTDTKRLRDQILRNRQRLNVPTLNENVRQILGRDVDVADAVLSNDLDISVRRLLASRRPSENGTLIVTESYQHFEREVRSYFATRSDVTFYALLAHAVDAGALILGGSDMMNVATVLLREDGDAVFGTSSDRTMIFSLDRSVESGSERWELFHFGINGGSDR